MTVIEAIEQLRRLQEAGHGSAVIRNYSELSPETYQRVKFVLHLAEENVGRYDEAYGTWVEVC